MVAPHDLPDLTPQCAGAVIMRGRDTFLLALGDEDRWETRDGVVHIPLSGVGGGIDAGETALAGLQREAQEEIGTHLEIHHSPVPTLVWLQENGELVHTPVLWRETPAPAFVILTEGERPVCSWMYGATLPAEPEPADVPGVAWVPLAAIAALIDGVRSDRLSLLGVELDLRDRADVPSSARVYLPAAGGEALLLRPTLERHGFR